MKLFFLRASRLGGLCTAVALLGAAATMTAGPSNAADKEVAQLKERVSQLEEQLVDMRVLVGTLQSLAKGGGGGGAVAPPAGGYGGGADAGRVAMLETQIKALTAQLEQLSDRVRTLGGNSGGGAAPQPSGQPGGQSGETTSGGGFGSTTVTPGSTQSDGIGNFIRRNHQPNSSDGGVAPGSGADGAQSAYEEAYGYWLQRNYAAAQKSFEQFLADYPRHSLAGNAQYWLGEAYFVQGDYNRAAKAFLKGYQTYGSSAMAPDSLLRLAMSLEKLGHRNAACSSLGELNQRFPQAPRGVVRRVAAERSRLGC